MTHEPFSDQSHCSMVVVLSWLFCANKLIVAQKQNACAFLGVVRTKITDWMSSGRLVVHVSHQLQQRSCCGTLATRQCHSPNGKKISHTSSLQSNRKKNMAKGGSSETRLVCEKIKRRVRIPSQLSLPLVCSRFPIDHRRSHFCLVAFRDVSCK